MGIVAVLRAEFQLSRLGFGGVRAERLCIPQWRLPLCFYLIYRFMVLAYAVACLAYMVAHAPQAPHQLPLPAAAYCTTWAYATLILYLLLHFLAASFFHVVSRYSSGPLHRRSHHPSCCSRPSVTEHALNFVDTGSGGGASSPTSAGGGAVYHNLTDSADSLSLQMEAVTPARLPWYLCAVWVLFTVVSDTAVLVTIVYFAFLFHSGSSKVLRSMALSFTGIQVHVVNSVLVLIEHVITAVPFRLLHIVYPCLYLFVYLVFSLLYWEGDHTRVIYPGFLDWNDPGPTVGYVLLTGFVFVPLIHVFFFLVHKAKMVLYERC